MCLLKAGLVQLIKGALCYSPMIPILDHLIISGINFSEQSCNNKVLITLVNTQIFSSKVKEESMFISKESLEPPQLKSNIHNIKML